MTSQFDWSAVNLGSPLLWFPAGVICSALLHLKPLHGDVAVLVECSIYLTTYLLTRTQGFSIFHALHVAAIAILYHLLSLVASTLAYRISPFHPLAQFPGPLLNKMTNLVTVYYAYLGRRHLVTEDYHRKYGKFVRIGPNTLSINSSAAIGPIYASSAAFNRSDWYAPPPRSGLTGIFFKLTKEEHNPHRKQWAAGFSRNALSHYETPVQRRVLRLVDYISMKMAAKKDFNLVEVLQNWAYDIMGELTFGHTSSLKLLETENNEVCKISQFIILMYEMLGLVRPVLDIMWLLPAAKKFRMIEEIAWSMIDVRSKGPLPEQDDLASHILGEHSPVLPKPTPDQLRLDTAFLFQAGADSTSSVLNYLFFYLISCPDVYARLQAELDTAFPNTDDPMHSSALSKLPYLSAVVDEGLRLGTPFAGLPRVVPKGGSVLDGMHVPGNTVVSVPGYSQQVSEENFWPEPLAFRPERWLPGGLGPGAITKSSAMMSFSFGAFGCLGKALALMEIRILVAQIVRTFDLHFAPGFDPERYIEGARDVRTTTFTYPLSVVATRRCV